MYIMTQTRAQGPCFWHIRTSTPSFQHLSDGHHLHRQLKYPLLKLSPWSLPHPTLANSPIQTFPPYWLYMTWLEVPPCLSNHPFIFLLSFFPFFLLFLPSLYPSIQAFILQTLCTMLGCAKWVTISPLTILELLKQKYDFLVARFNMRCKEVLAFAPLDVFTKTERCISGRHRWSGTCLQGQRPLRICGDSQDGCCMLPSLSLLQHYVSPDSNPQAVLKDL